MQTQKKIINNACNTVDRCYDSACRYVLGGDASQHSTVSDVHKVNVIFQKLFENEMDLNEPRWIINGPKLHYTTRIFVIHDGNDNN